MAIYRLNDVVTVREEHEPARVVNVYPFDKNTCCQWYEIEAVNLQNVPNREVKETDLHMARRIVDFDDDTNWRYFDKNWNELHEGDYIRQPDGTEYRLYLTTNHRLGVDATNPKWIETGRAVPCQYGIYPLNHWDVTECVKVTD